MSDKQDFQSLPSGVKVTYQGNVLICYTHRTPQENFESIQCALHQTTGLSPQVLFGKGLGKQSVFEQNGGKVEFYRETG